MPTQARPGPADSDNNLISIAVELAPVVTCGGAC
jgi:hypothetical protein